MHADGVTVAPGLARALVTSQASAFLSGARFAAVEGGTDNAIYRLGPGTAARFPLRTGAARQVAQDAVWLPRIATRVALEVPAVRFTGAPGDGYPHPWAIVDWIEGTDAEAAPPQDDAAAGAALAGFIAELQTLPDAGPLPPARTLEPQDAFVREQIVAFLPEEGAPARLLSEWEAAMALPVWDGPPRVVHGDLHPLNLLVRDGRLAGVIDWGALGRGDPARDLMCAWTVLRSEGRAAFREALAPDAASWARGRAHALAMACMGIPYYRDSNPGFRAMIRRVLTEVLSHPA